MAMKKVLLIMFVFLVAMSSAFAQSRKKSKEELAKMTPEQRLAYDNDRKHKKKPKKEDTTKEKVKRAKQEDRKARKTKPPKQKKRKAPK
jgi:hypothetical protein